MITSIHQCLVEVEEALRRMIRGVFLFFSDWLPTWIYEFIISGIWPVTIRLARVSLLFCLWLSILFCPFMPGLVFKLAWWWICGSTAWLAMAAIGSYWGLKRLKARRKAAKRLPCATVCSGEGSCISAGHRQNKEGYVFRIARGLAR